MGNIFISFYFFYMWFYYTIAPTMIHYKIFNFLIWDKAHRRKYDESIHTVVYNQNNDYLASGGADSLIKIFKVLQ